VHSRRIFYDKRLAQEVPGDSLGDVSTAARVLSRPPIVAGCISLLVMVAYSLGLTPLQKAAQPIVGDKKGC
jgi:hypothetical protein